MAANIKFDQAGIPAGAAGKARSDGLTGVKVTVTNASGNPCTCSFFWKPTTDDTAALVPVGAGIAWEFTPKEGSYGTYTVKMVEGATVMVKDFGVRLPRSRLLIPGLNGRGDFEANLTYSGPQKASAAALSFFNEANPEGFDWLAWWQPLRELFEYVEDFEFDAGFAGLDCLGSFSRMQYGGTLGNEESPISAPSVEALHIFVHGWNKWLRVALTGFIGSPEDQVSGGNLTVAEWEYAEGGETSASPLSSELSSGGWGNLNGSNLFATVANAKSELHCEVFPWEGGHRVLITYAKTVGTIDRCVYTDDCGVSWTKGDFWSVATKGATCLRWTGQNVVVGFDDGDIGVSTDGGANFDECVSPTVNGFKLALSNGEGTVILVGNSEFAAVATMAVSTEHGVDGSWELVTVSGVSSVRGGLFHKGKFYIWSSTNQLITSVNGFEWTAPVTLTFSHPGLELKMLENINRGVVNCGDMMFAFFHTADYSFEDIFFSINGKDWERSATFGVGIVMQANGVDSDDPHPFRVRLATTGQASPAHTKPAWYQVTAIPSQGSLGIGAGYAEGYLSQRSWDKKIERVVVEEADAYSLLPSAVGGAPIVGDVNEWAQGNRKRDIGNLAGNVFAGATMNLNVVTGDIVPVFGEDEDIANLTLDSGRDRWLWFQEGVNRLMATGGNLGIIGKPVNDGYPIIASDVVHVRGTPVGTRVMSIQRGEWVHEVRIKKDLPPAVDGVITLPTNSGFWRFHVMIDGVTDRLVINEGAIVQSEPTGGFRTETASEPAVTVKNHINPWCFQAFNDGDGIGLRLDASNALRQLLSYWIALTPVEILSTNAVIWTGGFAGPTTVPATGGFYEFHHMTIGSLAVDGAGSVGTLVFKDVLHSNAPGNTMVVIPNGVTVNQGVYLHNCTVSLSCKTIESGDNTGGKLVIEACLLGAIAGDITLGALWALGGTIKGNSRFAATPSTGWVGFTELSPMFDCLNNIGVFGSPYPETPHGHRYVNESNVAVAQRPRMAIKRGSTYVTPTDNGTDQRSEFDIAPLITDGADPVFVGFTPVDEQTSGTPVVIDFTGTAAPSVGDKVYVMLLGSEDANPTAPGSDGWDAGRTVAFDGLELTVYSKDWAGGQDTTPSFASTGGEGAIFGVGMVWRDLGIDIDGTNGSGVAPYGDMSASIVSDTFVLLIGASGVQDVMQTAMTDYAAITNPFAVKLFNVFGANGAASEGNGRIVVGALKHMRRWGDGDNAGISVTVGDGATSMAFIAETWQP